MLHTSAAQLASTSSSVSSYLTNSLRDNELDKQHEQRLHWTKLPQLPVFGQMSSSLPNHRGSLSGKADQFAGFPSTRFKSIHKKKRTTEKMDEVAVLGCSHFLSSTFESWKKTRPRRWPDTPSAVINIAEM